MPVLGAAGENLKNSLSYKLRLANAQIIIISLFEAYLLFLFSVSFYLCPYTLYNAYFLKDDESIDIYYPPNFYGDTSGFSIVEPRFFYNREYYKNCKPFNRFDLKPHPDYDFNIPKYIVKHYLDMKTIVKEDEYHKRIFC
ncbi:hypothetical protein [Campylobacter iguaniorum]|uniref:hypothetical protein n=1 Tax=Campylobacter iguaniorum TaxID=1244531 RepID=UPI0007C94A28|nr:hypothetical protein [Campylobacter iguaniorum]